jgi:tRNA threonylcarbamoyladenosine biosynthesis protein TsaB
MKLLAIETAGEACSAALFLDGEIRQRLVLEPRRQSELILAQMDELLAEAGIRPGQLDVLAYGCGPGSFTGVRIAAGVIQGVAFGADLPVVPVSTLAALAQRLFREQGARRILPAFDARMGELYWGCYEVGTGSLATALQPDQLLAPERVFPPEGGDWHGVGGGWESHGELLAQRMGRTLHSVTAGLQSCAHDVALLGAAAFREGRAVAAESALPVYLREEVAQKAT